MIEASISYKTYHKLYRNITSLIFFSIFSCISWAQSDDCNNLGAWLWRIEQTGIPSYEKLADSLHNVGINRIYIKVADGRLDTQAWPAIVDKSIIASFHNREMEVYAWSYNYPGHDEAQADALYTAINTGYDGYIIDIEMEFDNESVILENLVSAFANKKQLAISEELIDDSFVFGVSTWGNPADHNFRIDILDRYVDAYFPQTYLEVWGESYLDNPALWVEVGNREYRELGANKPIHHIISTEYNIITAEQINSFIAYAGPQTSIWRIPGGATTYAIWQDWLLVDWDKDFCELTDTYNEQDDKVYVYPNPTMGILNINLGSKEQNLEYHITNITGQIVKKGHIRSDLSLEINTLPSGCYHLHLIHPSKQTVSRFTKL